jgi:hypothetical protein
MLMYTFQMSWSFRAMVLGVVLSWGLLPQLACLMPEQTLTPAEMDCCKGMAADCSAPNMSHVCCQTVVRTDVGIAAKVLRHGPPSLNPASSVTTPSSPFVSFDRQFSKEIDHAPPGSPGVSSLILRI